MNTQHLMMSSPLFGPLRDISVSLPSSWIQQWLQLSDFAVNIIQSLLTASFFLFLPPCKETVPTIDGCHLQTSESPPLRLVRSQTGDRPLAAFRLLSSPCQTMWPQTRSVCPTDTTHSCSRDFFSVFLTICKHLSRTVPGTDPTLPVSRLGMVASLLHTSKIKDRKHRRDILSGSFPAHSTSSIKRPWTALL